MIQFAIHTKDGRYMPKSRMGNWQRNLKYAKKYTNKPAMFQALLRLMEESPRVDFYFEAIEITMESKGSQTLGAYNRIKKVKSITANINRKNDNT